MYLVDEIGKMELFSQPFIQTVRDLFSLPSATILATVPISRQKKIPFVEEIKSGKDTRLLEVKGSFTFKFSSYKPYANMAAAILKFFCLHSNQPY